MQRIRLYRMSLWAARTVHIIVRVGGKSIQAGNSRAWSCDVYRYALPEGNLCARLRAERGSGLCFRIKEPVRNS